MQKMGPVLVRGIKGKFQYRVQPVENTYIDNLCFAVEGPILRNSSLQTTYILI